MAQLNAWTSMDKADLTDTKTNIEMLIFIYAASYYSTYLFRKYFNFYFDSFTAYVQLYDGMVEQF